MAAMWSLRAFAPACCSRCGSVVGVDVDWCDVGGHVGDARRRAWAGEASGFVSCECGVVGSCWGVAVGWLHGCVWHVAD
eukprot:14848781-Alexandrium_andersonii.AAC.1